MAERKTKKNDSSVKAFVDGVADERRRKDCRAAMKLLARATGKRPKMWGSSIIGYGTYSKEDPAGKSAEWPVVAVSPRKSDLTIYIMPGFERFSGLMGKLGKHRTGRSCLYIKRLSDVDLPTLEKLIQESVAEMKRRYDQIDVS